MTTDAETLKNHIEAALSRARRRTLDLTDLDDETIRRQVSPLMSPLVWDLAHVGNYEDQWLLRRIGPSARAARPELDDLYDAFRHPRSTRPGLPLLEGEAARTYLARVREEVLAELDAVEPEAFAGTERLLADGFVYGMVAQHEQQHVETMLATHQLMGDSAHPPPGAIDPAVIPSTPTDDTAVVEITGGSFSKGSVDHPWALDNELPPHTVETASFGIDRFPVTNRRYLEFMAEGGYDRPELWTPEGWDWRLEQGLEAPQFWCLEDGVARILRFGTRYEVDPAAPVQHVCWYEADAFARWRGGRLPTETEWERAALTDIGTRPGGSDPEATGANLGGRHFGPLALGALPSDDRGEGCRRTIGDVWEWTATPFHGYDGFEAFPYREYSEVFFDGRYRVLKGGSWATDPVAIRRSFRNWDFPVRRQIFSGFRCAYDLEPPSRHYRRGPRPSNR